MEGLNRVWGYGELILCSQQKKEGLAWHVRGPCDIARDKEFFAVKMTETEDRHVVKMQRKCIDCTCNKGMVEVHWKMRMRDTGKEGITVDNESDSQD